MKALIQRVTRGSVTIDGAEAARIARGYVALVGVRKDDTEENARWLAHKTLNLRIFADKEGRMNRSVQDVGGQILVISQFTLYADTRKGNRPGFGNAAPPETAERLYEVYVNSLRAQLGREAVPTGRFGAHMEVELVNDGPVTVELTSD